MRHRLLRETDGMTTMRLAIRRNGDEIGQTTFGGTINLPGLYVSPVALDWTLTVPADTETLAAGVYDVVEIAEIELEETDWDRRAKMGPLSQVLFRKMLRGIAITASRVEAAISAIADEERRAEVADAWEYEASFTRLDDLVDVIVSTTETTPDEMDAAWTSALA